MPDIVDDRVYFLEKEPDGKYRLEAERTLADLGNNVPGFGDRITLTIHDVGIHMMEVIGRHYVRHIVEETGVEWTAWFVVVETVDLQEAYNLFEAISEVYDLHVKGRPLKRQQAPIIGASPESSGGRDFDHWRRQQDERDKHRPRMGLDAREMRVLRYMVSHPECLTVDLIPQAGEKTMEALSEAGAVRPGSKDYRQIREWHVTAEGQAEVVREDKWKNWG